MSTNVATIERAQQLTPLQEARGQITSMEAQFKLALPAHIPAERFVRVVTTAVAANQDLLTKCTRQSLLAAAMKAAQDGLLPDGRDAALVPFNGQAQYMPMIGGILKKIRNSGELKSISASVAYEKDRFFYRLGDEEMIEHEPYLDGDRGKARLVYAIARTKDGGVYREIMTVAEVEKVRAVSRAKNAGPWAQWWEEMAKKTVMRRLSKRLPVSTDLDDLIRRDDDLYDLKGAREEAQAANGGRAQSIGSRLDMLAQAPSREAAIVEHEEQAAAQAGGDEVPTAGSGGAPQGARDAAPQGTDAANQAPSQQDGTGAGQPASAPDDQDDDDGEPETPRDALIMRLRRDIMDGKSVPSLLNALTDQERPLLTEEDRKNLRDAGKAFASRKGSAG